MKAVLAAVLICFFLFDSAGFYFYFENQIRGAKSEARERVQHAAKKSKLVTIALSKADAQHLKWTGKNEFLYEGKMYDVVYVGQRDGQIIYSCYQDVKESHAVADLMKHIEKNSEPYTADHPSKLIIKTFDKFFDGQPAGNNICQPVIVFSKQRPLIPCDLFHRIIPAPPPDSPLG